MNTELDCKDFYTALSKAQGEFKPIVKDKKAKAGSFSYSYADINDVIAMIRPILAKHGLCVVQMPGGDHDKMYLSTVIAHTSGQFRYFQTPILVEKKTPQGLGSALTYTRRHALIAALCLECEDDDGAAAEPTQGPRSARHSTLDQQAITLERRDNKPAPQQAFPEKSTPGPKKISDAQRTRMFAISKGVPDIEVKAMIAFEGFDSSKDITVERYDHICRKIEERREILDKLPKDKI